MDDKVLLAHGSGGRLSRDLIENCLFPHLANPVLAGMDDSAVFDISGRLAFTTDSFVVSPLFFPGGDIGKLAVCGTINDLAAAGARPLFLSLALIIEEGFPLEDLNRIMESVRQMTAETGVKVVTGDTKVVNRGSADKLFINTAGIGAVPPGVNISGSGARPGDKVILSGTIGDHGMAVMAQRADLRLRVPVQSDCAPLNSLAEKVLEYKESVHCMRDPTRGGLASTLNELAGRSKVSIRIYEDRVPVKKAVGAACEMLGLDPLYVANEGKMVVVAAAEVADDILRAMKQDTYGADSEIIGEVVEGNPGRVVMRTHLGASRIIEMLSGELLPRIC